MTDGEDVIEAFATEAQRYCAFVERAATLTLEQRMLEARVRLAALYAAAVRLPNGTPAEEDPPDGPDAPHLDFGAASSYDLIFDPYGDDDGPQQPVGGDLADDLADIYRDVQAGVALLGSAGPEAACWQWRFALDTHWGSHALGALRALHWAIHHGGLR